MVFRQLHWAGQMSVFALIFNRYACRNVEATQVFTPKVTNSWLNRIGARKSVERPFINLIRETRPMEITNQSRRPLTIALPGGKKLRLGPLKSGQITARAAEHPAVKKLVEEGIIQLNDGSGATKNRAGTGNVSARPSQRRGSGTAQRQSGDR